jgi:hypothetical protein
MPQDNGIKDRCFSIEDGTPWWNSTDIRIMAPNTSGGMATSTPGVSTLNTVRLKIHRKSGEGDPPPYDPLKNGDSDFLRIDLYICAPTTSKFGPKTKEVKPIKHYSGGVLYEITLDGTVPGLPAAPPTPGNDLSFDVTWNLPENLANIHVAEKPGHKCLVARVYTDPVDTPNNTVGFDFPVEDDLHYAQRNICINTCSSPCEQEIWMVNQSESLPRTFQLRVVQDLQPSPALLPIIEHEMRLSDLGDFRLAEKSPALGFGLTIKEMPYVEFVRDQPPILSMWPESERERLRFLLNLLQKRFSEEDALAMLPSLLRRQQGVLPVAELIPSVEGRVTLQPGQSVPFLFQTDLDGEDPGTLHVFHVMEIEAGVVQGGVTLLLLKQ